MAKQIGIRILLLCMIITGWAGVYKVWFWPEELAAEGPELPKLMQLKNRCDLLYFGESSNISYDPVKDTNTISISGLLAQNLKGTVVGDITHQAYHMGIYLPLIKHIDASDRVNTLIVTLNLRTFDQACIHSGLETALRKQALYYAKQPPLMIHLRAALNHYDHVPEMERDRRMWKEWTFDTLRIKGIRFPWPTIKTWCEAPKFLRPDGTEDMEKRTLADHYIKAYAFVLKDHNPRVKDCDELVKYCKQIRKKLVFNLLPENTEYADSLVGPELTALIRYNRDYLTKRYRNMGIMVVDNLETVSGKDYIDQNWTTEHYMYRGRKTVADHLAAALGEKR